MIKRALIAVAVPVLAVALSGCGQPPPPPTTAEPATTEPDPAQPVVVQPLLARPVSGVQADLQDIALSYRQIGTLLKKKDLAFKTIEARSWLIAEKARDLVEKYEHRHPLREIDPRKAERHPELIKIKAPALIKDLDLVAINAKRLALAAAGWDAKEVREKFANLETAAERCLPAPPPPPEPARPAGAEEPASPEAPVPPAEPAQPVPPAEPAQPAPPADSAKPSAPPPAKGDK